MSRVRQHHCRALHVFMFGKKVQHFWKCVRVSRDSHVQYALGSSSIAQPFDSLCSKVFDEHPTEATPKEQKFCAAASQIHSVSTLDTPAQINFNSTVGHACARSNIDHHRRRPTSLNTNVGKCRSVRRPIFPEFPVLFVLPDTWIFFCNFQFSEGMWNVKMSGRPDGLFCMAQIMLCVNENSKAKVPATVALSPFFFYHQRLLSKGKA